MSPSESRASALGALVALHADIDRKAARLSERHGDRLQCRRGCNACCLDDLTVSAVEAELIRERHGDWLARATPHPEGACAFLDEAGTCRIYSDRPSVCRSQGLPLRVLFEDENEEIEERRDICPLNLEGGPALGELPEDDCWLIGPHELELTEIDRRFAESLGHDDSPRIALRDLFRSSEVGQIESD
jgi:Fe-S-cluster containining protein